MTLRHNKLRQATGEDDTHVGIGDQRRAYMDRPRSSRRRTCCILYSDKHVRVILAIIPDNGSHRRVKGVVEWGQESRPFQSGRYGCAGM